MVSFYGPHNMETPVSQLLTWYQLWTRSCVSDANWQRISRSN